MPLAYYDGQFVDKTSLTINPSDFGFARGVAIFEMLRVYGGSPFRRDAHLERMAKGAAALGIAMPHSIAALTSIVDKIIAANRYDHSAVKLYLTAGECGQASGLSFAACTQFTPHLMVLEEPVKPAHPEAPYGLEAYQRGQRLKIVPFERALPQIKSTNYVQGYVAARQYAGSEWDDILFTHRDGSVTEATRSNFFCVINGTLCTADQHMLHGITRQVVLEIARDLKIPVAERRLTAEDIYQCSEAFTSGSIAELVPASRIDDHRLATTMNGPIFSKLRAAFTACIAAESKPAPLAV